VTASVGTHSVQTHIVRSRFAAGASSRGWSRPAVQPYCNRPRPKRPWPWPRRRGNGGCRATVCKAERAHDRHPARRSGQDFRRCVAPDAGMEQQASDSRPRGESRAGRTGKAAATASGEGRGIRTPGQVAPPVVFKTLEVPLYPIPFASTQSSFSLILHDLLSIDF